MQTSMIDRVEMLQNIPTFGGINGDILRFLLGHARSLSVSAGETIFTEGEYTASMYVIEQGEVAIYKRRQQEECLMVTLATGDCLGEMALFDYMPRSSSACAIVDSELIEITSLNLYEIYKRDVEQFALLQMNLGREIARRLRRADDMCVQCPYRHCVKPECTLPQR